MSVEPPHVKQGPNAVHPFLKSINRAIIQPTRVHDPFHDLFNTFLDAPSHLYKRVCPSVRGSVCPSVSIKKNAVYRVLGASDVGYPALFLSFFILFFLFCDGWTDRPTDRHSDVIFELSLTLTYGRTYGRTDGHNLL